MYIKVKYEEDFLLAQLAETEVTINLCFCFLSPH